MFKRGTMVTSVMEMLRCLRASWFAEERGAGTVGWSGLPGVPGSALRKDLVRERPPGTYSAAPSYMALA